MRYFHIRAKKDGIILPTGGSTVGFEILDKDKTTFAVTIARCSERDVFNKARARAICSGRMAKGKKVQHVTRSAEMDIYEFLGRLVVENDAKVRSAKGA